MINDMYVTAQCIFCLPLVNDAEEICLLNISQVLTMVSRTKLNKCKRSVDSSKLGSVLAESSTSSMTCKRCYII